MSDNATSLAVIREEAGESAFLRICARLCGDRVWFPYRRGGIPVRLRILELLRTGYDVKQIAGHLGCSERYVRGIRRRAAIRNGMAKTVPGEPVA